MAITGLSFDAEYGTPGQPLTITPLGSIDVSREPRYYLASAPAASALDTLANQAERRTERSDLRLTVDKAGRATFTPDAAGAYEVIVYDVTLTVSKQHFDGLTNLPVTTDDELTGAPTFTATVYVAEACSRVVGLAPDAGTLTVKTYRNQLVPRLGRASVDTAAVLVPAPTARARQCANADDTVSALAAVRGTTNVTVQLDLSQAEIEGAIERWNSHLDAPGLTLHGAEDTTNGVAEPEANTLADALTLLNELRVRYGAHRILTVGGVHAVPDTTNALTAGGATDFATGAALWLDLRDRLWAHMVDLTVHGTDSPGDGMAYRWLEPPITEAGLIRKANDLRTLYVGHIGRIELAAPHTVADNLNRVDAMLDTAQGLVATANAWAESIRRHTSNLDASNQPLSNLAAYHRNPLSSASLPRPIVLGQASDLAGAMRLFERCILAAEAHTTDAPDGVHPLATPHRSATWGAWAFRMGERYALRLQRAWLEASRLDAPPPANANSGVASLIRKGWT